jgi:toxin ParE1/3/4
MEYAVNLSSRAERDLNKLFEHLNTTKSAAARRWFNGLERKIYSLERLPRRCPSAPESRKARRPIRQFLYGRKPDVYRILFEINDVTRTVHVLTIRHGARDAWKPSRKG